MNDKDISEFIKASLEVRNALDGLVSVESSYNSKQFYRARAIDAVKRFDSALKEIDMTILLY